MNEGRGRKIPKYLRNPSQVNTSQAHSRSLSTSLARLTTAQQPAMSSYSDPMEISPPFLPSTPPGLHSLPEPSPTQYKSEAIVISSDSESSSDELEGWRGTYTTPPACRRHKSSRPYNKRSAARMNNNYTTLDHVTSSRPTPNPPIKVLLALTPQPATLADLVAFQDIGARFSADFSDFCIEEMWCCISLYTHYREWAQRNPESEERRCGDEDDAAPPSVDPNSSGTVTTATTTTATTTSSPPKCDTAAVEAEIGTIHPFALRAKLEQEIEVDWSFFLPVLQRLIEREVAQGMRLFVIGGLKLGDVEGVRAFAQKVNSIPCTFLRKAKEQTRQTMCRTCKADRSNCLFSTDRRTSRHPFFSAGRRPAGL